MIIDRGNIWALFRESVFVDRGGLWVLGGDTGLFIGTSHHGVAFNPAQRDSRCSFASSGRGSEISV